MNFLFMQQKNVADAARKCVSCSEKRVCLAGIKCTYLVINDIVFALYSRHLLAKNFTRLSRRCRLTKCKQVSFPEAFLHYFFRVTDSWAGKA